MPTIISLENTTQEMHTLIGRKAVQLALLHQHFPVPRTVILTNNLFQQFLEQTGIKKEAEKIVASLKGTNAEGLGSAGNLLKERILATSIPEEILEEIKEAYAMLAGTENTVQKYGEDTLRPLIAVRPSPVGYDCKDLHTSILNIRGIERLQKAILLCWASFYSSNALEYRLHHLSGNTGAGFALLLQQMIDSQAAGVLQTQYKMNPEEVYIIGCKGLGSALANGMIAVDQYFITKKTLRIAAIEIGKQTFMLERDRETDKTTKVYLQSEYAEKQKIADRHLGELTLLSEKIEALFGKPQVVDFAIAKEQIFILGVYEPEWYKEQLQHILSAINKQEAVQVQEPGEEEKEEQQEEEISYGIVEELDKDQLVQVALNGENDREMQKSVVVEDKQQNSGQPLRMFTAPAPSNFIFSHAPSSASFLTEPLSQEAAEGPKEEQPEQYPEKTQPMNSAKKTETELSDVNEVILSIDPFALEQEMANAAFRWEQERSEVHKTGEEPQETVPQKSEDKQHEEKRKELDKFADFHVDIADKRFEGELTAVQKAAGTLIIHCFKELKQKLPREQWVTKPELRYVTVLAQNYSEKNITPTKEQVLYALNVVEKLQK